MKPKPRMSLFADRDAGAVDDRSGQVVNRLPIRLLGAGLRAAPELY